MPAKIAIIDGHPDADAGRLCHALATSYAEAAAKADHEVRRIEFASIEFPILKTKLDFEQKATAPPHSGRAGNDPLVRSFADRLPIMAWDNAGLAKGILGTGDGNYCCF